jgi:hypothetical protein
MRIVKKTLDLIIYKVASAREDLSPRISEDALPAQIEFMYSSPMNLDNLPAKVQKYFQHLISENPTLPIRRFFTYENAFVTNEGVIFSHFRVALPSLTFAGRKKSYYNSFFLKEWIGKKIVIPNDEIVVVVHDSNSAGNYYHWLIEACSRLILLNGKFKNAYLVVSEPLSSYVKETTKLLGYTKLLPLANDTVLKASKIILAERTSAVVDHNHNSYATHQDPELIRLLKKKLSNAMRLPQVKPYRLLYISRAKQKIRRLVNEVEVTNYLLKRGFEIIHFETLSFIQQAMIMNEAAVVIGVHGANLANILFMQPGQVIIELMNEIDFNSVYYRLSSYMQLDYYRLLCKPQENIRVEEDNIALNYQDLEILLNQIIYE